MPRGKESNLPAKDVHPRRATKPDPASYFKFGNSIPFPFAKLESSSFDFNGTMFFDEDKHILSWKRFAKDKFGNVT